MDDGMEWMEWMDGCFPGGWGGGVYSDWRFLVRSIHEID